ncbi:arginine--tRNA ligase [Candidatus Woesearchaeota archaeon]|nr:arginine--tRNA ligase [Candidatus Woesearchaeota archaeon]
MDLKEQLQLLLQKQLGQNITLERPSNPELGDFALPCFRLGKNPEEIRKILKLPKIIEKIEIKGLYINLFLKKEQWAAQIIKAVLKQKEEYGSSKQGKGKRVLIEHTSINPNASPHVGRARNALIGASIVNLLKFEGYKVDVHYFVNDIGKQIAMLVVAAQDKKPEFNDLLQLYVEFNKKVEQDPNLEKEVFKLLNDLEEGKKSVKAKFKQIVDICVQGQKRIFEELDIKYDKFDYESKFLWNKSTQSVCNALEATGKLETDQEGRKVINLAGFNLPMKNPILPITRADGTSLYMLRDIAYTLEKIEKKTTRNIVVLGEDQKLYFLQLKAILSLLQKQAPEVVHYSFVLLEEGKMSTRKGEVVLLEEFMAEARQKAEEELKKRESSLKQAKSIAYGAVKFAFLRVSAEKNITFTWNKALSFEGESAPYVQYAVVRANSILKREVIPQKFNVFQIVPAEQALIRTISIFPEVIQNAAKQLQPHLIANYALELAKKFNEFYHLVPVLKAEPKEKALRLALVQAASQTLTNALHILGIEIPEEM